MQYEFNVYVFVKQDFQKLEKIQKVISAIESLELLHFGFIEAGINFVTESEEKELDRVLAEIDTLIECGWEVFDMSE